MQKSNKFRCYFNANTFKEEDLIQTGFRGERKTLKIRFKLILSIIICIFTKLFYEVLTQRNVYHRDKYYGIKMFQINGFFS